MRYLLLVGAVLFGVIIIVSIYALCVNSGRISKLEETYKENWESPK